MAGRIAGVDFGSKTSGTTAIAVAYPDGVFIHQSAKGEDADTWLHQQVLDHDVDFVALDAPLSLPGALRGLTGYRNFHYRQADLESQAMSPMFLGGLTARAMHWAHLANENGIKTIEAYPKLVAQHLNLKSKQYKKDTDYLAEATAHLSKVYPELGTLSTPANWHQFDALLALTTALRFTQGKAVPVGDNQEGILYF